MALYNLSCPSQGDLAVNKKQTERGGILNQGLPSVWTCCFESMWQRTRKKREKKILLTCSSDRPQYHTVWRLSSSANPHVNSPSKLSCLSWSPRCDCLVTCATCGKTNFPGGCVDVKKNNTWCSQVGIMEELIKEESSMDDTRKWHHDTAASAGRWLQTGGSDLEERGTSK